MASGSSSRSTGPSTWIQGPKNWSLTTHRAAHGRRRTLAVFIAPARVLTTARPPPSMAVVTGESCGRPSPRVVASTARWWVRMKLRASSASMASEATRVLWASLPGWPSPQGAVRPPGGAVRSPRSSSEVGASMLSTMQDRPLTISAILRHGQLTYADSEVVTYRDHGADRATFATVGERVERLAGALRDLGVERGDRIGTFCWNEQEHLEAYLAVPSMGAVLHTLNVRLFPDQLSYVVNHAEDRVVLVDASLAPVLARVVDELKTVQHIVVIGEGDASPLGETLRYEQLLSGADPGFEWPELDERDAAAMCYTSGTTENPKGDGYSHRSTFLHSLAATSAAPLAVGQRYR